MNPEKKHFPLALVPAPRGWNLQVSQANGNSIRLIKPGRRNDAGVPYLFASQQDAWNTVKELFSLFLKSEKADESTNKDKLRNCKQCQRIFRAKHLEYCSLCIEDNELLLQQLWEGFQGKPNDGYTPAEKIILILNASDEEFQQIPELFKVHVQKQLAIDAESDNQSVSPARQLSKLIKSRADHPRTRRIK